MRTRTCLLLPAVVATLSGCWPDPQPGANLPPEVNGFIVNGERRDAVVLREGESVSVTIVAWDPNGDAFGPDAISWETTAGTLEGGGPSIRVKAPEDLQWETPPQEVSFDVTVTVSDGVNPLASRTLQVSVLPPCPVDNLPPVIHGVYADPDAIALGESTRVWVDAEDPEGLELTYTWTPPFGDIEGSGEDVRWVTDEVCCTTWYDVEILVSDGCKSSWSFVSVHVDV